MEQINARKKVADHVSISFYGEYQPEHVPSLINKWGFQNGANIIKDFQTCTQKMGFVNIQKKSLRKGEHIDIQR